MNRPSTFKTRLAASVLLLAVAFLPGILHAQQTQFPGPIKIWKFPFQRGEASIQLDHGPGNRLALGILGPPCDACASLPEVTAALKQVLHALPALGFDPHQVSIISTAIDEPEVRRTVAEAALRSKAWTACSRTPSSCSPNQTLVNMLNETAAFRPFNEVLHEYGLTLRVTSAEKVTVVRASTLKGLTLPPGTRPTTKVPINGSLELTVEKIPNH
jgi:hypothetical protein